MTSGHNSGHNSGANSYDLPIPREWQLLPPQEGDAPEARFYAFARGDAEDGSGTLANVKIEEIDASRQMPRDPQQLINGIYHFLTPNTAVLEVGSGTLESGLDVLYSIVKSKEAAPAEALYAKVDDGANPGVPDATKPAAPVSYILTIQMFLPQIIEIQGLFEETGLTGNRDVQTWLMHRQAAEAGQLPIEEKAWQRDPFDPSNKGWAANWGEQYRFDDLFPDHPLSVCRVVRDEFVDWLASLDAPQDAN